MEWKSTFFGEVGIFWRDQEGGPGFEVRATWQDQEFLRAIAGPARPRLPFSLELEGDDGKPVLAGELGFEERAGEGMLFLDLETQGVNVRHELLAARPLPPSPPQDGSGVDDLRPLVSGFEDLFPYVFLHPWPRVRPGDLENRFVRYEGEGRCSESSSSLYCQLVALRKLPGAREAMEDLAVAFIDGDPQHGFEGQFLGSLEGLEGSIRWFSAFTEEIRRQPGLGLPGFKAELEELLGMDWEQIRMYLLDPDGPFAMERDRAWQNLFALTIVLGYDLRLLEGLVRTVVMASLAERIAGEREEEGWTPLRIQEGAWATVTLPGDVFPLPPATAAGSPPPAGRRSRLASGGPGWIEPYAVGDLKMVQQRLVGYSLGEVSSIENVLRGEHKEATQRRLTRREEGTLSREERTSREDSRSRNSQTDLTAAVQEALSEQLKLSYQTDYGPPTEAEATGFLQLENLPDSQDPMSRSTRDESRFAREITARTAQLISRRVLERRSQTLLQEDEETVVRRFDATGSAGNVRGVYRWVNKVYSLRVVNRGHRLLLEILMPRPAAGFIASELALTGRSLAEPVPPQDLGLESPLDISTDPESDLDWANLAARYGALDVQPPPPATATAALSLQAAGNAQVQIPAGYEAGTARLALNWGSATARVTVSGVIGQQAFTASSTDGPVQQELPLNGETSAVPLAVTAEVTATDGGGTGQEGSPASEEYPPFVLNVEVGATLSSQRLEEWQLRTWREILAAYERQRERYYGSAGIAPDGTERRNPLWYREVERRELTRDAMRQLLQQARRLLGISGGTPDGAPTDFEIAEPAYLQFLEKAFEWNEMTFSFNVLTEVPGRRGETAWALQRYAGADSLFTAFLQAAFARLLLPVRPDFDLIVPYFLASGMIWPGENSLTPANPDSVPLINELKSLALLPSPPPKAGETWEVTVPTSMVLLQDSPDLPSFPPDGKGEDRRA
jgi:hypothetical protein